MSVSRIGRFERSHPSLKGPMFDRGAATVTIHAAILRDSVGGNRDFSTADQSENGPSMSVCLLRGHTGRESAGIGRPV